MTISAKVIAHSRPTWAGDSSFDITTLQLEYPRIIHSEVMTHRVFSRNASSSRAIPVDKQLQGVLDDPFEPTYWGANQSGMQAQNELEGTVLDSAKRFWGDAMYFAVNSARTLSKLGLHKQLANRIVEPWSHINVLVTATEWDNFFALRDHEAAQPEIRELARKMRKAMDDSTPARLEPGEWHMPYIGGGVVVDLMLDASAGRCARVSYKNHDQSDPNPIADADLACRLKSMGHMSPFEHQATPMKSPTACRLGNWEGGATHVDRSNVLWSGTFRGWVQYRQAL